MERVCAGTDLGDGELAALGSIVEELVVLGFMNPTAGIGIWGEVAEPAETTRPGSRSGSWC
jgi:hypothetical protein